MDKKKLTRYLIVAILAICIIYLWGLEEEHQLKQKIRYILRSLIK